MNLYEIFYWVMEDNISLEVKIITATIDIFREKGVKFTMDDIANKLGVSKRTIYENINSKEILLSLLVDEVFDSIKHQGQEIIEDNSINDLDKLKRLLTVIPTSYNTIDYTKIHEIKKFYPNIYEKIINRLDICWEPTEILINKCIQEKLIKKVNLNLMKSILIGSIRNLIEDDNLHKEKLDYKDTIKNIIDIMFDGLVIK